MRFTIEINVEDEAWEAEGYVTERARDLAGDFRRSRFEIVVHKLNDDYPEPGTVLKVDPGARGLVQPVWRRITRYASNPNGLEE